MPTTTQKTAPAATSTTTTETTPTTTSKDRQKTTITDKIDQLNQKTEWFYSDDFSLDEAAKKYQEATKLAKDIEKDLGALKNEIEIISKDFSKE